MSSMTLAQIAEKPITVATDETISNFADSRQGRRLATSPLRRYQIASFAPCLPECARSGCRRLKWRQRRGNELTIRCRDPTDLCKSPFEDTRERLRPLRDYLKKQTLPEFVLSFEQIEEIIDAALPRAAHRASWWETLRSPQEKMPQREACLAGGYIATRLADGKSVRFKRMK